MRCLQISAFILLSEKIIQGFLSNFKAIRHGCIKRWGNREELRTWLSNVRKLGFQVLQKETNVRAAKQLYYKSMGFSVFLRTMFVAAYPENQPSTFRQLKVDGTETYDQLYDMEEKIAMLERKVTELQRTVHKHNPETDVGASDSKPKAIDLPRKKSRRPSHAGNGSEAPSKGSGISKKPPPKVGRKPPTPPVDKMPSNVSVSGKHKMGNGREALPEAAPTGMSVSGIRKVGNRRETPPKAEPHARKAYRKGERKSPPLAEVSTKAPAAGKRKTISGRKTTAPDYPLTPKRTRRRTRKVIYDDDPDDEGSSDDDLKDEVGKIDDVPTNADKQGLEYDDLNDEVEKIDDAPMNADKKGSEYDDDLIDEEAKSDDAPTKDSNGSASQKSNSESSKISGGKRGARSTEQTASKGEAAVKEEKNGCVNQFPTGTFGR